MMNDVRLSQIMAFFAGLLASVCALAGPEFSRPPECPNQLVGLQSSIWQNLEIPVCWEETPADQTQQREWVQDAVQNSWEKHSSLHFVGWGQCDAASRGIRIEVADVNPHTKGIGNQLDGVKSGMVLDFTFKQWSLSCQKQAESCIRIIAVHEFGHALGFTHEHNRIDTPVDDPEFARLDKCHGEDLSQGTSGDIYITPYDLYSVMNYCNPKWAGEGNLSAQDLAGLNAWYGAPAKPASRYDGNWHGALTYNDPTCIADPIDISVRGMAVNGQVKAADGQVADIAAQIDSDSRFENFVFRFSYPSRNNFVDTISLHGPLTGGTLHSTDCGCGQYHFSRQ